MTATSRPQHPNGSLAPASDGGESFAKFFECWILEQSRDLAALRAAATARPDDADLRRLVDRILGHYEHYYRAKSAAASADVLPMFAPSWISATESLYLWCGGWRPTAAIQLLYSKSGVQLEAQLPAFLDGGSLGDGDLGGLSAEQLQAADQLQRRTIRREREIEEAAAGAQESLATTKMVELAGKGGMDAAEGMEREMEAKAEDEARAGDGGRAEAGDAARRGGAAPACAGRALPRGRRGAPPRRAQVRPAEGRRRRGGVSLQRRTGTWLLCSVQRSSSSSELPSFCLVNARCRDKL